MADEQQADTWTLTTTRNPDGTVDLTTTIATEGEPMIVVLRLNREEARAHARGVMAAAGDAIERTFGGEGA
ncbi:hypothetical protein [Methylobacterium soli]|uniref:Uncharacterized protein n=1 Tax=Methylobacterium soli TaxID=553447 RepID=A0A6L3SSW8_9HYPH|nr:hypothetical protein [Methylobacterium soli]KAB1076671.1 hypothetical protein F6X53_22525 [Methylobacterium soli]GJE44860.1 hypothetical protein AEGHOMDF_4051 [Methylobacterium soli]